MVLAVRSVPKTSSPYDDVHPQVPVCREIFPAFNLARSLGSLRHAGDRVGKRLVLVHMRPGSWTGACVSGVRVDCIAAGMPHCLVGCLYEYKRRHV